MDVDPRVRVALASASLSLLDEHQRQVVRANDIAHRDTKTLKYLIRMITRATPFGLLSGVLMAQWAEATAISLTDEMRHTRTRPDMRWLFSIARTLEADAQVRRHLRYVTNSAVTLHNGRVHLPEKAHIDQPPPYHSVSLRATGVVLYALECAREPIAYADLVDALREFAPRAALTKITTLIDTLCEQTLLLSDLRPPLTIPNPPRYIQERLAQIPEISHINTYLDEAFTACAKWDAACEQQDEAGYRDLITLARRTYGVLAAYEEMAKERNSHYVTIDYASVLPNVSRQESWYQIDLAWHTNTARIASAIKPEIARAVEVMLRLSSRPKGLPFLETFRLQFSERYGSDRLVPLLEVIDSNRGIGLPAEYTPTSEVNETILGVDQRERTLLALAADALAHQKMILHVGEQEIAELGGEPLQHDQLPPSLDYFCAIAAPSAEAIDRGEFLIVTGPSALHRPARSNVGRFADVIGEPAMSAMRATAALEEQAHPEALWAELTYLPPNSRSCNVAIVPQVRQHAILYGVLPTADTTTIPLHELVLGVRQNRLILRWMRTGQEVIVQCSHVLNHGNAPGLIRFLNDLYKDGVHVPQQFSWGLAEAMPFLPRVQCGRVVLRCAQWDVAAPLFRQVLDTKTLAAFTASLVTWRAAWRVPRHVYLLESDHRLLLDLEDEAQREILRTELRTNKVKRPFVLIEAVPGPEDAWVCSPAGHHLSECVVSLIRRDLVPASGAVAPASRTAAPANTLTSPYQSIAPGERLRPPGSDWLFMKLYVGRDYQQEMLGGPVYEMVQHILAERWADAWFFIRYNDPDPHIRLRFHGDPAVLMHQVFPHLCAWGNDLLAQGACVKYMFDSYDREIERYGGREAMALAEQIFAADSMATIRLLALLSQGKITLDLTDLTILTLDDLLATFEPDEDARRRYFRAYGATHPQSGSYYREHNRLLRPFMRHDTAFPGVQGDDVLAQILKERQQALALITDQWHQLEQHNALTQPSASLYGSLTHMHCNRLLGADRDHEELVRAMLDRLYEGFRRMPSNH